MTVPIDALMKVVHMRRDLRYRALAEVRRDISALGDRRDALGHMPVRFNDAASAHAFARWELWRMRERAAILQEEAGLRARAADLAHDLARSEAETAALETMLADTRKSEAARLRRRRIIRPDG